MILTKLKLLKTILHVAKHPEDTDAIFRISVYQNKLAAKKDVDYLVKDAYSSHPNLKTLHQEQHGQTPIDLETLAKLQEGTFGRVYADHMRKYNLDPNFFDKFEHKDQWNYLRFRARQTHDIWHVLSGFSTHYIGELGLQAMYVAQFSNSLSTTIIINFLFHTVLERKYSEMKKAFQALVVGYTIGQEANSLLGEKWEELWELPLNEVQEKYNITPTDEY